VGGPSDEAGIIPVGLPTGGGGPGGFDVDVAPSKGQKRGARERYDKALRKDRARRQREARDKAEQDRIDKLKEAEEEAKRGGKPNRAKRLRRARERAEGKQGKRRARKERLDKWRENKDQRAEERVQRAKDAKDRARKRREENKAKRRKARERRHEETDRRFEEAEGKVGGLGGDYSDEDWGYVFPHPSGAYIFDTNQGGGDQAGIAGVDDPWRGETEHLDEWKRRQREKARGRHGISPEFTPTRFGAWNAANAPMSYLGQPGAPRTLEGWSHLATATTRSLQRIVVGAFGGPDYLAANMAVVHRNRTGNPPTGSRLGAHWNAIPGAPPLDIGRGQDVVELVSTLEAPEGTTATAGSSAVVRIIREHIGGGSIRDRRPLVLLENERAINRGRVDADMISDMERRFYVGSKSELTAAKLRAYRIPGETGRLFEVGSMVERSRVVTDSYLWVDSADGILESSKGIKTPGLDVTEGAPLKLADATGASVQLVNNGEAYVTLTDSAGLVNPNLSCHTLTCVKLTATSIDPESMVWDAVGSKPSALSSGSTRGTWWDSGDNKLKAWDGSASVSLMGGDVVASATSADPGVTDRNSVTVSAPLLLTDGDSWIVEAWGVNGDGASAQTFRMDLLFAPSTTVAIVLQTVPAGSPWTMSMIASRGSSSFWSYRCHTINGATNVLASSTGVQDLGTIAAQVKVYTTSSDGHVRGVLVDKREA
jgi:hypothetical protein